MLDYRFLSFHLTYHVFCTEDCLAVCVFCLIRPFSNELTRACHLRRSVGWSPKHPIDDQFFDCWPCSVIFGLVIGDFLLYHRLLIEKQSSP